MPPQADTGFSASAEQRFFCWQISQPLVIHTQMKNMLNFWIRFPAYFLGTLVLFFLYSHPLERWMEAGNDALKIIQTRQDIQETALALEAHYKTTGHYPAPGDLDDFLRQRFPDALKRQIPIDRWGNPLRYKTTEDQRGFFLVSMGRDGLPDTPHDFGIQIFYWTPREEEKPFPSEETVLPESGTSQEASK
jgi:hypothetical protein